VNSTLCEGELFVSLYNKQGYRRLSILIAIIAFIITYTIFVVTYPPSAEEALIYGSSAKFVGTRQGRWQS